MLNKNSDTVGSLLKGLREQKGWTLRDVAERMSKMAPEGPVSRAAVSNWEQDLNPPSAENLFKLSDLYKVDVNRLRPRQLEAKTDA